MRRLLIVSDTSALSALAKMAWLEWLRLRWERVAVPGAVWRELKAIGDESGCQRLSDAQSEGWLTIHSVADRKAVESLAEHLDAGESEAIVLALQLQASALLIDEMDGREAAKKLGLATTGTLGIIVWAKRNGLVASAEVTMEALIRSTRFYVSDSVKKEVRRLAGEDG